MICLSPVLLAAAACTQAAPARTGEPAASAAAAGAAGEDRPASSSPAGAAQESAPAVEGVGAVGQPAATGESVLEPPDGKWLTDESGQQYFILEVPRIEGQFVWLSENEVRLRGGLPLKLERYDDKTFYAKILKVAPGAGTPVRGSKPTISDLEKAKASYKIEIPVVSRLRLVPFDAGLPRRGQWRNGFDVADMNGDGQLDIVHGAARKGASRPVIFLGDGKGTWRAWTEVRFPGDIRYDYGDVAAADLNGDGHMDMVLAMHILGLRALVGDGKGGFTPWTEGLDYRTPKSGDPPPGFSSRAITTVDWNGDKRPDVLALGEGMRLTTSNEKPEMQEAAANGAVIYLNEGDGKWVRKDQGSDAGQLFGDSVTTGDFDGDGRVDFVTAASFVGRKDIVHLGRGDGWETAPLDLRPRGYVTAVTAGDFDGDGRDDVAAAYINSEMGVLRSGIDVFLARPDKDDGLSWERRGLAAVDGRLGFYALDAGNLDGDTSLDLVALTGEGQAHIFLGESQGSFARAELPAGAVASEPGCRGYDVRLVDLDGDGRDEIVANFAGEQGTSQILQSMGPEGVKQSCPSEGSIRAWKPVPAGEAR